jgi:hypothetical protein
MKLECLTATRDIRDIGMLNSVKFNLEKGVDELTRKWTIMAKCFGKESKQDGFKVARVDICQGWLDVI